MGEIIPQAYFSRNALKMASSLTPVMRFYQKKLFIVVKPTAILLDGWLGKEGITYFREEELKAIIVAHAEADESEMVYVEGLGALNFLEIDKASVLEEGKEFAESDVDVYASCHRPVMVKDEKCTLGVALSELKQASNQEELSTDVINHDLVLVWTPSVKRVITGADILGHLLIRDW